ncbi:BA14K family protein [Aureimonas leprariae]|uniref:Lectin-like protein BA14k n=1 Tax=Plantimonas leprariae TaxID=2615207 RepID=A0A7V7PMG4_9HYPH|nr:BA14K family protein [Aureimonas leprariae]KAB0678110.1 hypothetical protein F6X38_16955 [Aureimonas leprariae]
MRGLVAAVALMATMLAPQGIAPAGAQVVTAQYGGYDDRYSRGYDDDYGSYDDPYYDRGRRYGRDDGYRSYDRRYGRYDDRDYDDRDYGNRRDGRRGYFDDDGDRRGTVVKRLSKKDRICLQRHSSYDPETGTFRDGRGGRKPCRV